MSNISDQTQTVINNIYKNDTHREIFLVCLKRIITRLENRHYDAGFYVNHDDIYHIANEICQECGLNSNEKWRRIEVLKTCNRILIDHRGQDKETLAKLRSGEIVPSDASFFDIRKLFSLPE